MKYSVATIVALAATALAIPTNGGSNSRGNKCENVVCTDSDGLILEVEIDVGVCIDVLGLDIGLDVDASLAVLSSFPQCEKVYCCHNGCGSGEKVPSSCGEY